MGTPNLVWQILTVLSLVYTAIFTLPYLAKCVMYPRKVCAYRKEQTVQQMAERESWTGLRGVCVVSVWW
jgi:hypothetical protein